ncbi:Meckel syndrome type 1 protein [Pararge aegeria]|uniref:Meckel syndrome type 1 protein n=1 Tax=Pararge aegeria TaxID=116150 RepID=UPI0019D1349B|nr:Meckel syndrome type 1 protein [Pararge aegeria]
MSKFICNKLAGIYWPKQPLDDISIRIKLKCREGISALPKFEDYKDKSNEENLNKLDNNIIEEHDFRWQNKVFSNWEYQKYSDVYNCNSETELKYHDRLKQPYNYECKKVFSYIHEDYYLPLPVTSEKKVGKAIVSIGDCFNRLNLEDIGSDGDISSSMKHLLRSEENMSSYEERWIAMHIVLDSSEYNEDSQLLFKEEHILVSLYHNVTYNYLIVTPNVNDIEFNAYCVENQPEIEYGVEIEFGEENSAELEELLNNLLKKWEKQQKKLLSFVMPPLGRKNYFVTFEIISAMDFDMDNLYIEFHIKISDDLQCNGDLRGRTHISKHLTTEKYEWKYGHTVELELECATGIEPVPIKIYLEAISVDWWGRHRTEGYSYLPLSLEPGEHTRHLSCSRPEELDTVKANNRRFFVGGCHLIKDLDVLANPQLHNANFRYTETGSISVRWRTISQSRSPGAACFAPSPSTAGSSTALLSGAEAVLRQYRKAKATLAAATSSVPEHMHSKDG